MLFKKNIAQGIETFECILEFFVYCQNISEVDKPLLEKMTSCFFKLCPSDKITLEELRMMKNSENPVLRHLFNHIQNGVYQLGPLAEKLKQI